MRRAPTMFVAACALLPALVLAALGVGEKAGALSNWQAFWLGLVQGATELLPISSSGHLVLVPWLGDWTYLKEHDEFNHTFDVALHLGTLVAVVAYFRRELVDLVLAFFGRGSETDRRVARVVAIATVPAALVGAAGEGVIADRLGEPWQIAILLAVFGVVLWIADRRPERRRIGDVGYGEAVAIGLAQSLSLAPGVSRSGVTISAARFLGLARDDAARLSFLLLVPITFGAVLYKGVTAELPAGWAGPFAVGVLAAAASGVVAITALLGYVRRHDYSIFVVYRLLAATVVLLLIATGVREAGF